MVAKKPDGSLSRKKRRRRRRSRAVEERREEFVTRWRPETTFGYRSFDPGEGRLRIVNLDLEHRRTEEANPEEERRKSPEQRRQLYQHSSSPQTLRFTYTNTNTNTHIHQHSSSFQTLR